MPIENINSSSSTPINPLPSSPTTSSVPSTQQTTSPTTGSTSSTNIRRSSRLLKALTTAPVSATVQQTAAVSFQAAFEAAVSASQTAYNLDASGATNYVNTELQKPLTTLITEEKVAAQDARNAQMANKRNEINLHRATVQIPLVQGRLHPIQLALIQARVDTSDGSLNQNLTAFNGLIQSVVDVNKSVITQDTSLFDLEASVKKTETSLSKYNASYKDLVISNTIFNVKLVQADSSPDPISAKTDAVTALIQDLTNQSDAIQAAATQAQNMQQELTDNVIQAQANYQNAQANLIAKADALSSASADYNNAVKNIFNAGTESALRLIMNDIAVKKAALVTAKNVLDQALTSVSEAHDNLISAEQAVAEGEGVLAWAAIMQPALDTLKTSAQGIIDPNTGNIDLSSFNNSIGLFITLFPNRIMLTQSDLDTLNTQIAPLRDAWTQSINQVTTANSHLNIQTALQSTETKVSQIVTSIKQRNILLREFNFYTTLLNDSNANVSALQANLVSTGNIYLARNAIRVAKQAS